MPVHDGDKVHKASVHVNISDVRRPNLIGLINGHIPEQIGINLMARMAAGGSRFRIDCLDTH